MSHLKFFKDISKSSVAEAGGKGASLGEMTRAGIPVPPGFVVLASAFDRFLEETKLNIEIAARLKEVNIKDTNSIDRASAVIRDSIHDKAMPGDLEEEILGAFDELFVTPPNPPLKKGGNNKPPLFKEGAGGGQFVAVRSSATAEDSAVASWAGELETYLNTTRENVVERVKQCWSSLFTPRAIFYRHEKNLIDHYVSVAVVIQKMIQSEISGIAFTVHPVTEDHDQMIIEAGFGLGEAIVGGQITPDSYVVSKSEMRIFDVSVSTQTRKLVKKKSAPTTPTGRDPFGLAQGRLERLSKGEAGPFLRSAQDRLSSRRGYRRNPLLSKEGRGVVAEDEPSNEWVELSEAEGEKQKLSGTQIIELAQICMGIEKHYGFPCDIEWAFENGNFYITQSRPITTLKP